MSIFPEFLTPEEEQSHFNPNEVDNESFLIEQIGGTYPIAIPEFNEKTFLTPSNENRSNINLNFKDSYSNTKFISNSSDLEKPSDKEFETESDFEKTFPQSTINEDKVEPISSIDDVFTLNEDDDSSDRG